MNPSSAVKPQPESRDRYRAFRTITTRWIDNDAYGHVNNVIYDSWFDTVVNAHLIEHGALGVRHSEVGRFVEGEPLTAAKGHFVHVYVGREERRPVAQLSAALKTVLEALQQ